MVKSSIVEYFRDHSSYRCGYCKSNEGNYSHGNNNTSDIRIVWQFLRCSLDFELGRCNKSFDKIGMWAHVMTAEDYQSLIDRGWRRSGKYVYKPTNNVTCCPAYTINCHALEFQLSKSQKKVLKRFNQYLMSDPFLPAKGASLKGSQSVSAAHDEQEGAGGENITTFKPKDGTRPTENVLQRVEAEDTTKITKLPSCPSQSKSKEGQSSSALDTKQAGDSAIPSSSSESDSKVPPAGGKIRKAKEMRKERRLMKLRERGIDPASVPHKTAHSEPKTLEDILKPAGEVKKKFSITTVGVNSPEFEDTFEMEYQLYREYQMKIHQDAESDCTRKQFKRFLCDTPIVDSEAIYGTYHQQYYVDDTLIAVGVIDILPNCLSSVYFFYSPDVLPLSPGTLGALREIAHVRSLNQHCPSIRYYYMGFYIHSCVKMRYKGSFSPSYLLCPEEYTWHLLDNPLRDRLSAAKYCRLNPQEPTGVSVDVNKVGILFKGVRLTYQMYRTLVANEDDEEVQEYANLVGEKAGKSMLLYRGDS